MEQLKQNNLTRILLIFFSTVMMVYSIIWSTKIYTTQNKINNLEQTYANINTINYGLFNMQEWKIKAFDVFSTHIDHFEISPKAFDEAEKELEKYLYSIYNKYIASGELFKKVFDDAEKSSKINKVLLKMFKDNISTQVEALEIKQHIPDMAKQLAKELRKQEPRFKEIMQSELRNLLQFQDKYSYVDPRIEIFKNYRCSDLTCTNLKIKEDLHQLKAIQKQDLVKISLALFLLIVLLSLTIKWINISTWVIFITTISILLLILGITMPMIVIDARMNSFVFNLFEKDLEFGEQVVFFQSKSILDVAQNLLESRGIDLKIVGLLVISFSVVFPLIKLVLSGFYLQSNRLRNSKIVKNMIFYLGKWSMADVFVVALFMTYIGFYGLFNAQLQLIEQNKGGFAVETVNYTHLAPGALFFTSYCILSIILGIVIGKMDR
jgi:cell division protein FtsL